MAMCKYFKLISRMTFFFEMLPDRKAATHGEDPQRICFFIVSYEIQEKNKLVVTMLQKNIS